MKKTIISLILFVICSIVVSQTIINPNQNISGIFTNANSPYIIMGKATIPQDSTLIIQAGVTIKFKTSVSNNPADFTYSSLNVGMIYVKGKLLAIGRPTDSIIFTGDTTNGKWGIIFYDEMSNDSSKIKYARIENSCTVKQLAAGNDFPGAVSFYKNNSTIENCLIRFGGKDFATDKSLYSLGCGIVSLYSNPRIINNYICFNKENGIWGISNYNQNTNPEIIGNLITNNKNGIDLVMTNPILINNTIIKNTNYGISSLMSNFNIINNILWSNSTSLSASSSTVSVSYSLIKESTLPTGITNGGNNIFAQNPLFENDTNNYNLKAGSPCIDHGKQSLAGINMPATDITGNPRITNNRIDIGAYEYKTSTNTENKSFNTEEIIFYNKILHIESKNIIEYLIIYNESGQEVYKNFNINNNNIRIQLENLIGLNFLHVKTNKSIINYKIIINN